MSVMNLTELAAYRRLESRGVRIDRPSAQVASRSARRLAQAGSGGPGGHPQRPLLKTRGGGGGGGGVGLCSKSHFGQPPPPPRNPPRCRAEGILAPRTRRPSGRVA